MSILRHYYTKWIFGPSGRHALKQLFCKGLMVVSVGAGVGSGIAFGIRREKPHSVGSGRRKRKTCRSGGIRLGRRDRACRGAAAGMGVDGPSRLPAVLIPAAP